MAIGIGLGIQFDGDSFIDSWLQGFDQPVNCSGVIYCNQIIGCN